MLQILQLCSLVAAFGIGRQAQAAMSSLAIGLCGTTLLLRREVLAIWQ